MNPPTVSAIGPFLPDEGGRIGASDPGDPDGTFQNRATKLQGCLRAEFDYTHVTDVMNSGLHDFIDRFQINLKKVDKAIFETFFATKSAGPDKSQAKASQ